MGEPLNGVPPQVKVGSELGPGSVAVPVGRGPVPGTHPHPPRVSRWARAEGVVVEVTAERCAPGPQKAGAKQPSGGITEPSQPRREPGASGEGAHHPEAPALEVCEAVEEEHHPSALGIDRPALPDPRAELPAEALVLFQGPGVELRVSSREDHGIHGRGQRVPVNGRERYQTGAVPT